MTDPSIETERANRRFSILRPILTNQPRVGWLSVWTINFIWFCEVYNSLLHGVGITFVARRLTSDPRLLVLVSTLGLLFSGSIGPLVNYLSDRVHTRLGRRRPFVVTAYFLSAVGLLVIPLTNSVTTLLIAVACHAFVHAFASPAEPLYMELVPQPQQGRSQAIRNVFVQSGVIFFFQVSLAQFNDPYPEITGWFVPAGGISGVHLTFWVGSSLLFLVALYLGLCTRERAPSTGTNDWRNVRLWTLLKRFPKDVFADLRWWPVYGLYITPALVGGMWGNLQPLMVVEQFGFSMTEMARIGLPVSLAGLAVFGPLIGHYVDRSSIYRPWQLVLAAGLLFILAWWGFENMPVDPRQLPDLVNSLGFCLPLGAGGVCILLWAATEFGRWATRLDLRSRLIIASIVGQIVLSLTAWLWIHALVSAGPQVSMKLWLGYLTVSQTLGLASSVTLMPLLFSRIPTSRFGTVSSGFGIFGALVTYALGNLGGVWVHEWARMTGTTTTPYSELWLLQVFVAFGALALVFRCLRAPSMQAAN